MVVPQLILAHMGPAGSASRVVSIPVQFENLNWGYKNQLSPNSGSRKAHADRFLWSRGEFGAIQFRIVLVPLREGKIQDAASLLDTVTEMASMALPFPGETEIRPVLMRIGTWFGMRGFMDNWDVALGKPWDEQGRPMKAEVSFQIVPTFSKNRKPTSSTFSFRM